MSKVWEFYENMNEIVYVTDVDTYQLVYMNKCAREKYGIKNGDDISAKKCYELLQNSNCQCLFCSKDRLRKGEFIEWVNYNQVLGKKYNLKDTLIEEDGRRYKITIAIDMEMQEEQRQTIVEFKNNEIMLNDGIGKAMLKADPEESIEYISEYMGRVFKSERVYVFEETVPGYVDNTYEWCAYGVKPQKDNLQKVPFRVVKLWYELFKKSSNVIIKNREDIRKSDPIVYAYLKPQDINSLVVSPLYDENKIIGFYGVDNPPAEMLNNISTIFQILGHFLSSLLRRRNLMRKFKQLSYYDQMTGLKNRHSMTEYIENIDLNNSIGIVYTDVMELKKINDTQGHKAGDELIIRAADCLRKAYGDLELFRIGGDEFLIVGTGVDEEKIMSGLDVLQEEMKSNDALMAVGCIWSDSANDGMDMLIAQADNRMYEDKRAYYRSREM